MRKLILPIFLGCLSVSFTIPPPAQTLKSNSTVAGTHSLFTDSSFINTPDAVTSLYDAIGLQQYGLSKDAFTYAYRGYTYLLANKKISRTDYLTICDFSQSSRQKRLYIIDMAHARLSVNTYVAHGRNSGGEYATQFSNKPESLESSLGFYITGNTYTGKHGLSLKIDGIDNGYNDNALQRNIVIHGAAYVDETWLQHSPFLGRSYGCPAIPQKESAAIITTIKNGTCLFIYHPAKNYLHGSKILNG